MRIESLHDALSFFPDIDGFWQSESLEESESQILSKLPPNWATEWTSQSVELLTQLARVQGLRGNLPMARATLDQARQMIATSTKDLDPKVEVRWLLEQGRMLCLGMSPVKAQDMFDQAWTQANKKGLTFFAIDAALMQSTIRPPKFQNEWLLKAFALAESSTDPQARLWLSQLLFLQGWHAFDFRQFEKALEFFDKAMAQPRPLEEPWKVMAFQWSRARTMRALGQVEQALAIQQTLLNDMSLKGNISGHVYLEIAECQQMMKQTEQAKSNFELAYADLSVDGWYADNRADELSRMKYLFKKR
jgi:tetratricopeptide (TPR) repeat protein